MGGEALHPSVLSEYCRVCEMAEVSFGETMVMPIPLGPSKDPIPSDEGLYKNIVKTTDKYAYIPHGERGMFMVAKLSSFDLEFFPLSMLDFLVLVEVDRIHVHVHVSENGDMVYKAKPISASEDEGLEFSTVLKKGVPYKEDEQTQFKPTDVEAYKKISEFKDSGVIFAKFLKEVMTIINDQIENSMMP